MKLTPLVAGAVVAAVLAIPAAGRSATTTVVHIKNYLFVPAVITVPLGTTVTFINDDDEAHTVTAVDRSFDSEGLDGHQRWKHVFAKAGRIAYFCELHPQMKATVIVTRGAQQ